jgi:hypothetical protein
MQPNFFPLSAIEEIDSVFSLQQIGKISSRSQIGSKIRTKGEDQGR